MFGKKKRERELKRKIEQQRLKKQREELVNKIISLLQELKLDSLISFSVDTDGAQIWLGDYTNHDTSCLYICSLDVDKEYIGDIILEKISKGIKLYDDIVNDFLKVREILNERNT